MRLTRGVACVGRFSLMEEHKTVSVLLHDFPTVNPTSSLGGGGERKRERERDA